MKLKFSVASAIVFALSVSTVDASGFKWLDTSDVDPLKFSSINNNYFFDNNGKKIKGGEKILFKNRHNLKKIKKGRPKKNKNVKTKNNKMRALKGRNKKKK